MEKYNRNQRCERKCKKHNARFAVFSFSCLLAFSILMQTRLNDIFMPSQMKAGFYFEGEKINSDYNNYLEKTAAQDCSKIPCQEEVYHYFFWKTSSAISNPVKSNAGASVEVDSGWVKSAGIGRKE